VHHYYVEDWAEWRWSSLHTFFEEYGADEAKRIWEAYPLHDYGKGWDETRPEPKG